MTSFTYGFVSGLIGTGIVGYLWILNTWNKAYAMGCEHGSKGRQ